MSGQPSDEDRGEGYEVRGSTEVFDGAIISVRQDTVVMPDGSEATRDAVRHPGAVGILALDDQQRVLLIRQYRHPVGRYLWELPAGLLDKEGEPAREAAARELAEETGLRARRWDVLVDALNSPGMSNEAIRVYLARDLSEVPADERHQGADEEADLTLEWRPLADAAADAMAGRIRNVMAVVGVLAATQAAEDGFAGLRPADADWPDRPDHAG